MKKILIIQGGGRPKGNTQQLIDAFAQGAIMGHSNINMTLNYYAHATPDNAMAEMERLIA